MANAALAKARRKLDRARRAYLNGPALERLELRAAYRAAAREYEQIRTNREESLAEQTRRLTGKDRGPRARG